MCSVRYRYFREIGTGMIYVFELAERCVRVYGFKAYHKRKRFRDHRLLFSSRRFYLLSSYVYFSKDPEEYFGSQVEKFREFKIGDYL